MYESLHCIGIYAGSSSYPDAEFLITDGSDFITIYLWNSNTLVYTMYTQVKD